MELGRSTSSVVLIDSLMLLEAMVNEENVKSVLVPIMGAVEPLVGEVLGKRTVSSEEEVGSDGVGVTVVVLRAVIAEVTVPMVMLVVVSEGVGVSVSVDEKLGNELSVLVEDTSSEVTLEMSEATIDDGDEIVVLASVVVLGVGEIVLMKLVAVTASSEEITSVGVTERGDKTDDIGELDSVIVIGVGGGVLMGVMSPSEEIGSVGVGVMVVVLNGVIAEVTVAMVILVVSDVGVGISLRLFSVDETLGCELCVTMVLLEAIKVGLTPEVVVREGEAVLMKLVIATTSPVEISSVGVTEVAENRELLSVMVIGVVALVGGVVIVVTVPSKETGSVGMGVSVAV